MMCVHVKIIRAVILQQQLNLNMEKEELADKLLTTCLHR